MLRAKRGEKQDPVPGKFTSTCEPLSVTRMQNWIFIARQHAMHAKRDIVMANVQSRYCV